MSRLILPRRKIWTPPQRQRGYVVLDGYRNAGGGGGDPYWANVVSLLHFDGPDGSTTFTDQTGKTWTAFGNAQIDTAQSKFGTASGLFDGVATSFISTGDSIDWFLESGDFTLELWFRPIAIGARQFLCGQSNAGATSVRNLIEVTAAGKLRYGTQNGSTVAIVGTTTLSAGSWYHLAVTKSGTTWRIFVNGSLDGSVVDSFVGADFPGPFTVGRIGAYSGLPANGHIDDFRATKGVARYTASFTPPAAAFPDY